MVEPCLKAYASNLTNLTRRVMLRIEDKVVVTKPSDGEFKKVTFTKYQKTTVA